MFKGSMVALVTPMHADGSIDKKSLHDLIEWHIAEKTDAIVVTGTTGESVTLSNAEKDDIIASTVKQVAGRIPVIAGTGTNSTLSTVLASKNAQAAGANACLIVTPYYNKPTQKGLYEHYKLIAESISIPIILYNVPGRTACDLLPETVAKLAKLPNIMGIKEASGKIDRWVELLSQCESDFALYSGDDLTSLECLLKGGHGVISVTANVAPRKMHDMCAAVLSGDKALAVAINEELIPLHKKLFLESNPIPTKWALHQMGMIPTGIRLPLLTLDSKYHTELQKALQSAGALQE
ncbi:MAG: 4-hydroxy-tetrahydrodipicolinate synthase [Gammaproteobacteria bacterium]|nr:4-hydroxy-tetrahydrodipicolinate synthase [Gammaproteobacteria bacterium]